MVLLQVPPEQVKPKHLQVISEQLSERGVPVLLMDVKGDLSGIAMPGEEKPFITERHGKDRNSLFDKGISG